MNWQDVARGMAADTGLIPDEWTDPVSVALYIGSGSGKPGRPPALIVRYNRRNELHAMSAISGIADDTGLEVVCVFDDRSTKIIAPSTTEENN